MNELSLSMPMTSRSEVQTSQRRLWAVLLFLLGLLLFVGFPARNLDGNDYIELLAVQSNDAEQLYNPNHLLFRPMLRLLYDAQLSLGLGMDLETLALRIVGLSTVASLVLMYLWLARLVPSNFGAVVAALGFGISWVVWTYGTSTMYFLFSVALTLLTMNLLLSLVQNQSTRLPWGLLMLMGLSTTLSILFWQFNVFFVPSVLLVIYLRYRSSVRNSLITLAIYLISMAVVGLVFLVAASLLVFQARGIEWSIGDFFNWGLSYNSARLEIWGVWGIDRIPPLALSSLAAILPAWEGLGLQPLLRGEFQPEKLLPLLSLVALGLVIVLPVIQQMRRRSLTGQHWKLFAILALGSFLYVPFTVWWDPTDPHWLYIPLIAFWTVIAVIWQPLLDKRLFQVILLLSVAVVGLANFSRSIWPDHALPAPEVVAADCLTEVIGTQDLYITYQYDMHKALSYYHGIEVLSLFDSAARLGGPAAALEAYEERKTEILAQDGSLFLADPPSQDEGLWVWLEESTGLTRANIEALGSTGTFAINCEGSDYLRIES